MMAILIHFYLILLPFSMFPFYIHLAVVNNSRPDAPSLRIEIHGAEVVTS